MSHEDVPVLTQERQQIIDRWLRAEKNEKDNVYYKEVLPLYAPEFSKKEFSGSTCDVERVKLLISVVGFSWQPIVLMANKLMPEKIVLICSEKSGRFDVQGKGLSEILVEYTKLKLTDIEIKRLSENYETSIYGSIREIISCSKYPFNAIAIDMTGGKKSMSASAALTGYVLGCPVVYVDYQDYGNRRPTLFSEFPAVLLNPLEVFGDIKLAEGIRHFNQGRYEVATALFESLTVTSYDSREPKALAQLAGAFNKMARYDFKGAEEEFSEFKKSASAYGVYGKWMWLKVAEEVAGRHQKAASSLSKKPKENPIELLAFSIARCRYLLNIGSLSETALLAYATLERALKLRLQQKWKLNVSEPLNKEVIQDHLEAVRKVAEEFYGSFEERRFYGAKLQISSSAIIVEALERSKKPEKKYVVFNKEGFKKLQQQGECRHGNPLSHAIFPVEPDSKRVGDYLRRVEKVIKATWGDEVLKSADELQLPRITQ